ncbi:MAG: hypothetical protein OEO21_13105, partial [Candidatus Krumholzibacteria bacterium]|nr:hypothetical protein [Candidatus Krumholzibacteria bacterium]
AAAGPISRLGFSAGAGIGSYREDLIVPLGFSGPGVFAGVMYARDAAKSRLQVEFRFRAGYLENRYAHGTFAAALSLRPSWTRRLLLTDSAGELRAGLCAPLSINYLIDHSWDDAHLYWLAAYGLGVSAEWQKTIVAGHDGLLRMEFPLLAMVSRPPSLRLNKQDPTGQWSYYLSKPNQTLQLETLDTYRAFLLQLLWRRGASNTLWDVGLEFTYEYCDTPEPVWALNTSLFLSIRWRIRS